MSAGFVQVLEFTTTDLDGVRKVLTRWEEAIGDAKTVLGWQLTRDLTSEDRYLQIVSFPSREAATRNSDHPATTEFAIEFAQLCEGPVVFRDLEVIESA
jgi:quinol monooxygenase YgiN